jgi:hypothetical protein
METSIFVFFVGTEYVTGARLCRVGKTPFPIGSETLAEYVGFSLIFANEKI